MWVFDGDQPARPLTTTGFNNPTNWGVRGIQTIGDKYIFFGTNSGWNYPVNPAPEPTVPLPGGQPLERAGWQLLKYAPTRPKPLPPAPTPDVPTIPLGLRAVPAVVRAGQDVSFVARLRAPRETVVFEACVTLPAGFTFTGNNPGLDIDGTTGCFDTRVAPMNSDTLVVHAKAPGSPVFGAQATAEAHGVSPAGEVESNDAKAFVTVLKARKPKPHPHPHPHPPHKHHHDNDHHGKDHHNHR